MRTLRCAGIADGGWKRQYIRPLSSRQFRYRPEGNSSGMSASARWYITFCISNSGSYLAPTPNSGATERSGKPALHCHSSVSVLPPPERQSTLWQETLWTVATLIRRVGNHCPTANSRRRYGVAILRPLHLPGHAARIEVWGFDNVGIAGDDFGDGHKTLLLLLFLQWHTASLMGKKKEPRWLWHAFDHQTGKVLAYVFGRRKDEVFLQLYSLPW